MALIFANYIFENQPDRQQPAKSEQKDRREQLKIKYFLTSLVFLFFGIQESMLMCNPKAFYSLHCRPLEVLESQKFRFFIPTYAKME